MKDFLKKHYHLFTYISLFVILVIWICIQPPLYSSSSEIDDTKESENIIDDTKDNTLDEAVSTSDEEGTDGTDSSATTDVPNTSAEDMADESETDSTSNMDIYDTTYFPGDEETDDPDDLEAGIDDEDSSPAEDEQEDVVPDPEAVEGVEPGKAPFDLCLANVNESLNVRTGPSEEYEIIAKFRPDSYARILEASEEWSKIESGDVTGYANNRYLITGDKAFKKIKEKANLTITVTQKLINIRKEPGTDSEILRHAKKDEVFEYVPDKSNSDWFAIIYDDGSTAYVATTLAHVTCDMKTIDSLTPVG